MGSKTIAKPMIMLHRSINTFYRKKGKVPKTLKVRNRDELMLMMKTICKKIAENISERKAGVHIDRLGYFFVWKLPKKSSYSFNSTGERYNYHTDHHIYTLIYMPSNDKLKTFSSWLMEAHFDKRVKQAVKDKIRAGFKYKAYPYSIYTFNRK